MYEQNITLNTGFQESLAGETNWIINKNMIDL